MLEIESAADLQSPPVLPPALAPIVEKAAERLPARLHRLINLRYLHRLTGLEIADSEGVSTERVQQSLEVAVRLLNDGGGFDAPTVPTIAPPATPVSPHDLGARPPRPYTRQKRQASAHMSIGHVVTSDQATSTAEPPLGLRAHELTIALHVSPVGNQRLDDSVRSALRVCRRIGCAVQLAYPGRTVLLMPGDNLKTALKRAGVTEC